MAKGEGEGEEEEEVVLGLMSNEFMTSNNYMNYTI